MYIFFQVNFDRDHLILNTIITSVKTFLILDSFRFILIQMLIPYVRKIHSNGLKQKINFWFK